MTQEIVVSNAIIESASIDTGDRGLLTAWIFTKHSGGNQGFGGYALYLPKDYTHHDINSVAGHFIFRCMQIAGVENWKDMKGRAIRIKHNHTGIEAIGHIVNDDWFSPKIDFKND